MNLIKIKPKNRQKIISMFYAFKKNVDIAREFKVSPERIRQILIEEVGEEVYEQMKETRKKFHARVSRIEQRERYAKDHKFRQKIINNSKKRYAKNKI